MGKIIWLFRFEHECIIVSAKCVVSAKQVHIIMFAKQLNSNLLLCQTSTHSKLIVCRTRMYSKVFNLLAV